MILEALVLAAFLCGIHWRISKLERESNKQVRLLSDLSKQVDRLHMELRHKLYMVDPVDRNELWGTLWCLDDKQYGPVPKCRDELDKKHSSSSL